MTKNKYWYFYYYSKCPNCDELKFFYKRLIRSRPKPKNKEDRMHVFPDITCPPCSEDLSPIKLMEMGG